MQFVYSAKCERCHSHRDQYRTRECHYRITGVLVSKRTSLMKCMRVHSYRFLPRHAVHDLSAELWVYTSVLRQLVNRMYRDRDYLDRRKREGRHTAYDYAVDRDLKALAWAIRAIVRYTPADMKAMPEPPKPPRKPSRRLSASERAKTAGRPSWNGQPKQDWAGPDLPPRPSRVTSAAPRHGAARTGEEKA
jgi:hypothetical protein